MNVCSRFLFALVAVLAIVSSSTAQPPSPQEIRCVIGMNAAGVKIAAAATRNAYRCAQWANSGALPTGMNAQTCLGADLRGVVAKTSARASAIDGRRCAPPPEFGYSGATATGDAANALAVDLVADLFGGDLSAALMAPKCQIRLLRDTSKLTSAQLKAFLDCKKRGLRGGTVGDGASLAGCLEALDTDPGGKITASLATVAADMTAACGLYNLKQLFPGYCAFADDVASCVNTRARCRVCEALNRIDSLATDCETFDDGIANGSCGACMPDPDGLCCTLTDRDACGHCGGTGLRCDWAQISVAPTHACGLKLDGTLACWGNNFAGELEAPAGAFTQVVSGGSSSEELNRGHSCALRSDQSVECWGRNDVEQASPPAESFTRLAAGSYHTCGLHPDGTIGCWGLDSAGESTPPPGTFVSISADRRGTCALRSDGEAVCWGTDFGYGGLTPLPGPFIDLEKASLTTYAIRPDKTVVRWGEPSPQFDPPAGAFAEVDGAVVNACGRRLDGTIECWPAPPPLSVGVVPPVGAFVQVDAGERIYCAIRSDAVLVCWGDLYTDSGPPPK